MRHVAGIERLAWDASPGSPGWVTLSAEEVTLQLRADVAGSDPAAGQDDPIRASADITPETIAVPWTVPAATLLNAPTDLTVTGLAQGLPHSRSKQERWFADTGTAKLIA